MRRFAFGGLVTALAVTAAAVLSTASPAAAIVSPPNRIKLTPDRTVLYDTATEKLFRPRGFNYIRLARSAHGVEYHSTFEPGQYSTTDVDHMLQFAQSSDYNVVRVFIDPGDGHFDHGLTRNIGSGWYSEAYMDNVANFIRRAADRGLYVLPSLDGFPFTPHYVQTRDSTTNANAEYPNLFYMNAGHLLAKRGYMQDFANAMRARLGAYRTAILAYETDNEAFWFTDRMPFSMTRGTFIAPNGLPYNMAVPAERQQAADASMNMYAEYAAVGVRAVDPDAMVTIGFGTIHAVGKPGFDGFSVSCGPGTCRDKVDYRYPGRPASITQWTNNRIDFVDLHVYPGGGSYSLAGDLATSEVGLFTKPYILGELGADKRVYGGGNVNAAAVDMRAKQIQSCGVGRGAQGWLFWTYDADIRHPDTDQVFFFSLADGDGAINGALAPSVRSNPCAG